MRLRTLSDPRSLGIKLEASAEKDFKKSVKKMITRKIGGETYLPFAEITRTHTPAAGDGGQCESGNID